MDGFFYGELQASLEQVEALMAADADPKRPYDFKYQARELLCQLKASPCLGADKPIKGTVALAIIEYLLGGNHFETEEITQGEIHYRLALDLFLGLDPVNYLPYLNTVQDLLNSLGIITANRGENDEGLELFLKAEELYRVLLSRQDVGGVFTSNFSDFLLDRDAEFRFIIDGGLNLRKAEQSYTLTMFYLAQCYSKTGDKQTAARYCGETMKRQILSGDYLPKDWAINTVNLADYYVENHYYSQAFYTLQCGFKVVPEGKKRKLRATLHMQTGRCLAALMEHAVNISTQQDQISPNIASQTLLFEPLAVDWSSLAPPQDLNSAKELFKQTFNHLKVALEFFVIDGYVTEHIELKRDMSSLYKHLCVFEPSPVKVTAMMERRLELLEGFTREINKQAYARLWQQLMNEVASIYIEIYECRTAKAEKKLRKGSASPDLYNEINQPALLSIERQVELLDFVEKFEKNDDTAKDIHQSALNLMFGIARIYSKLEHCEVKTKVGFMEKSLRWYERIVKFLQELRAGQWAKFVPDVEEQMRISQEMVALLPMRISQVNYGEG